MKYVTLLAILFAAMHLEGQQTSTIITRVAHARHRHVSSLQEYSFFKDSLEKLFKERLPVPVLIGIVYRPFYTAQANYID